MNTFATPDWESNPVADKICNQLVKGRSSTSSGKNKKKKDRKNKKLGIKSGRVEKTKLKKETQNTAKEFKKFSLKQNINKSNNTAQSFTKNSKNTNNPKSKQPTVQQHPLPNKTKNKLKQKNRNAGKELKTFGSKQDQNQSNNSAESITKDSKNKKKQKRKEVILENVKDNASFQEGSPKVKKQKPKLTHQTLFCQKKQKVVSKEKRPTIQTKPLELKERISSVKKLKRLKKKLYKKNQNTLEEKEEETKTRNISRKTKLIKNEVSVVNANSEITNNEESLKLTKSEKYKKKLQIALQQNETISPTLSKKQKAALPLRERMLEKLKGARFRYLNEQMYTTVGKDAKNYFESDRNAYQAYHEGYKQQVERWPLNPLDIIIQKIKKLPKTHIIADFGCGEAKLAKSVPHKVHSLDLVAVDESVTACDMARVPLKNNSVNVVVFCLSLMGTNLTDYILEANRVLSIGGLLQIAEVESRFENIDNFIKNVQSFGFTKKGKDLSHDLFVFLDFIKKEDKIKKNKKLPDINLKPCLYKKR